MYNKYLDLDTNVNITIYASSELESMRKIKEYYKIMCKDSDIDIDYSTVYGISYIYSTIYKGRIYE